MPPALLDRWRRRRWQATAETGRFADMQPMIVVTGGSEGIGLELARAFAELGMPMLLVARDEAKLKAAARQISETTAVKAYGVQADLSSAIGVANVRRALAEANAYCDILINNAGAGLAGTFESHPQEAIRRAMDLNVVALTALTREVLPGMLARGRGGVINIASLAGYVPGPYQAVYYASKAYVISLTEAIAHECRGMGVRVLTVAPGPVDTAFHRNMGSESAFYALLAGMTSPRKVARAALRGYRWGGTVVVPGVFFRLLGLAMRILPHPVLVPFTGFLLKIRQRG